MSLNKHYQLLFFEENRHTSLVQTLLKKINYFSHFRAFHSGTTGKYVTISTRCTAIAKSDCFKEGAAKNVYEVVLFYEEMVWRETLRSKQLL